MPRARVLRETELLKSPDRDATGWQDLVYALPGAILYFDPAGRRVGPFVEAQATGAGNFQMNGVDVADFIVQQQVIPRAQIARAGGVVRIPGATAIGAQRRNVIVPSGRTFWVNVSDLQIIQEVKPPSGWLAAPVAVGALGIAGALTKLGIGR